MIFNSKKEPELKEAQLKVMEGLQKEAYQGIVRIDKYIMKKMGLQTADTVEIIGNRKTVALVDKSDYPSDYCNLIIRMDEVIRRNAQIGIGETVKIRKAEVKEAKGITIAPKQEGIIVEADSSIFEKSLLGRVIIEGDLFCIGKKRKNVSGSSPFFDDIFNVFEKGFGLGSLAFIVVKTNPENQPVIITKNTEINIRTKSVNSEGLSNDEVINIKKLPNLKNLIEVKSFEDIKTLAKKYSFINKFEDDKQIIYFIDGYFYKKDKIAEKNEKKIDIKK